MSSLFGEDQPELSHLAGLNAAQREAAVHEGGPLIVLAGPGTGKTRVIVRRIVHMVKHRGVDPASILSLTFTNKAAGEMRERLAEDLGPVTAERVNAYTFNGFGALLLRRFSDLAGLPAEPAMIDSSQRTRLMRSIVSERGLFRDAIASGLDGAIARAQKLIGAMTSAGLTPALSRDRIQSRTAGLDSMGLDGEAADAERARAARLGEIVELWAHFDSACLGRGLIGFDHQIAWSNRVLREKEIASLFVRQDYRHIVVDEFQDVNNAQIELLGHLAPSANAPDLCVVGDDDQAIYGFRGADDRAFTKFEAAWPGATTVMLEENYRSATDVLGVAASVIGRAHERFRAGKVIRRPDGAGPEPDGARAERVVLENFRQAGEVIASMIGRDLSDRPGASLSDYAVIGRNWGDVHAIRAALELEGYPCRSAKARAPGEDPGVLDVMAWIDLLLNPAHTWSLRRLLLRPPFLTSVEWVNGIERAYRAERSRVEDGGAFPGCIEWLRERMERPADGSPDAAWGVAHRFVALFDELAQLVPTAPAHEMIAAIVRRTDAVHADLLDGRARAARVSAVVGLLRFATERADRLDEPRDLAAFMSYYNDLDDTDKSLRGDGLTHEDDERPGERDGSEGEAVQMLTAHRAKGLEFDTVFLPRVDSQHGYPSLRKPDAEEAMPAWLGEDDPDRAVPAEASRQDEERRLFYVGCTRAERRLVVLGTPPKKTPSGVNFFCELREEAELMPECDAADVLGPHPRDGVDHEMATEGWAATEARRGRLRDARRVARLNAAAALEAAALPGVDPVGLDEISERLRDAAARMAVIASAVRGEDVPGWAAGDALRSLHASLIDPDPSPVNETAARVLRPMTAPLSLSFTKLSDWERCPRCFAVKHLLRLPEPASEKSVIGTAVHKALELFYARFNASSEDEAGGPTLENLLALGRHAFEGEWAANEEIDGQQLDRVLALLRNAHEHLHSERLNPVAMEHQFKYPYEHEGTHWISGKIDRIDEAAGGFTVVDYKTGQASKRLVEPPSSDLQFGIYARAMRAYVLSGGGELTERDLDELGPPAGGAEYWVLSTGERGRVSFDEMAESEAKLRKRINKAIDGMLAGAYTRGGKCSGGCSFLDPGLEPSDGG